MTEPNNIRKGVPIVAVIVLITTILGWLMYRIDGIDQKLDDNWKAMDERIDQHSERITSLEGYKDYLEALKEIEEEYKRANQPLNFNGFLRFIVQKTNDK